VCGIVNGISVHSKFVRIVVDDGTGSLTCTYWMTEEKSKVPNILLGQLIVLHGRLGVYKSEIQVTIDHWEVKHDPNFESLYWTQTMKLKKLFYRPTDITPELIQELKSMIPGLKTQSQTVLFSI
jgi:hypothetical protein